MSIYDISYIIRASKENRTLIRTLEVSYNNHYTILAIMCKQPRLTLVSQLLLVNYTLAKAEGASEVITPTSVGSSFRFLSLRSTDK